MTDITKVADEIKSAFEALKSENDARLSEIEKKGSADVVTTEKVERINQEITSLNAKMAEMEKRAGRPAAEDASNSDGEIHRKAFESFARKGREDGLSDLEAKAMTIATNSGNDGGHLVPAVVAEGIYDRLLNLSPMRSIAEVVSTSSSNYSFIINKRGTGSGWVDEDDARTATATPSLLKITMPMGELYANAPATQQLLDDSAEDVEAFLMDNIAADFAQKEGAAFVTGTGTKQPKGFLNYSTALTGSDTEIQHIISGAEAALPTNFDKYIDMLYALKAGHRANATWVANSATFASLRKVVDDNGRYLWEPAVVAGQPSSFLGRPVVELEDMPAVAADALPLAVGDFKAGYKIADRIGIRVLRDPYSNKPNVLFYATVRVGGCIKDIEAIKVMKVTD